MRRPTLKSRFIINFVRVDHLDTAILARSDIPGSRFKYFTAMFQCPGIFLLCEQGRLAFISNKLWQEPTKAAALCLSTAPDFGKY
jgi:hypothetical protein